MGWAGHVERVELRIDAYRLLVGKPEGKKPFGIVKVDGRIILKWILKKWDGTCTELIWFRIGAVPKTL
jgi:hypothetical protein